VRETAASSAASAVRPDETGSAAELDVGLTRLRDEVSSVAGAIEHVRALELAGAPFESPTRTDSSVTTRTPTRSDP
jgi:hypothetical protein